MLNFFFMKVIAFPIRNTIFDTQNSYYGNNILFFLKEKLKKPNNTRYI